MPFHCMQVLELRRFGADAILAEASLSLSAMPSDGRPKYMWLTLQARGTVARPEIEQSASAIFLRLCWTQHKHRRAYRALSVSLAGIGVSAVDSLSAHVLRELIYIRFGDIQVRMRARACKGAQTARRPVLQRRSNECGVCTD